MSPSIRTMGFFMSEINFCNTKEQLNHLGEVVTGKVGGSPSGADIDTSTLPYTGQVRKTLPALEGEYETSIANKEVEADAAIDQYRLLFKGAYATGITLDSKFEYINYNGESYFATNPPYTTTSTTPDADSNLFVGGYITSDFGTVISGTEVKNRRGTTAEISNFTPAIGELLVSTDNDDLILGDGVTQGGTVVSFKQSDTVAALKERRSIPGDVITTKGYYAAYDGGGGKYINRGQGFTQVADGYINHASNTGDFLELIFTDDLNYLQAGGKGDWDAGTLTGTDNTPILQNAINYLNPFDWEGSVSDTNAVLRQFRCSIFVPGGFGRFMLGSPVLLNPYTSIVGPKGSKSFGMDLVGSKPLGAMFIPNFVDWNKYVFDVAPYNSSGQRVTDTSIAFTNSDNDNSVYTRVYGIHIENILVIPDFNSFDPTPMSGDIPFSPLRLFGSTSSAIKDNFFAQFLHGPSLQACWDYDYEGNLVQTFDSALSIFEGTVGNIGGINYCNKLGLRERYSTTPPPWWPQEDGATFIAGDYDVPSSLVVKDVTSGKAKIGTWIQEKYNRSVIGDNASFGIDWMHSESIDSSLIALKGCELSVNKGKTFLPSNRLFRPISRLGGGSTVTMRDFDYGCCGPFAEYIENGVAVDLLGRCVASDASDGTPNQGVVQVTEYTIRDDGQGMPSIYYEHFDRRPIKEIWVNVLGSGVGSDDYYGFGDNSAMVTVGAALDRVFPGQDVRIKIRNGSSSTTNEIISTTPNVTNANVELESRYPTRPHTISGEVSLYDVGLKWSSRIIWTGPRIFSIRGKVNLAIGGQSLIDASGEVFNVGSGLAATLSLMKESTAAFSSNGALSQDSSYMSVDYVNASSNSTLPAGGWGADTKVL